MLAGLTAEEVKKRWGGGGGQRFGGKKWFERSRKMLLFEACQRDKLIKTFEKCYVNDMF